MANGYCPSLLRQIEQIAGSNASTGKITPAGFLKMLFCCQNSSVNVINDGFGSNSHKKGLVISYRQRPCLDSVQDVDDCDINRVPVKAEWTLPTLHHKQTSFFLSDEELKKYCDDASRTVMVGLPATAMMREHYDLFLEHANILLRAINETLVTDMATKFGKNVTIQSSLGKVININKNGANLDLNDGIIALLNDLRENEICEAPCIVGGGLMASYDLIKTALGISNNGVDISRLPIPQFWYDKATQHIWGQDTIGVFAKGSVKFLSYNKYLPPFAGHRGNSYFFTAPFPVMEFAGCDMTQCLRDLRLDVQMRYIDCPTLVDVNGAQTTVNRGWQVILSKEFGLWTMPDTGYAACDNLAGSNGALLYYLQNNCEDCASDKPAYAYSY